MKSRKNGTLKLTSHTDARGNLIAIESKKDIPFEIKRAFVINNVPEHALRGGHAYFRNEFALCLSGSCKISVSDGAEERTFLLDRPDTGLLIPEMTWRTLFDFTRDCILLVLSDAFYDTADCLYDYDAFLRLIDKESPSV